jgi:hypothetical protein
VPAWLAIWMLATVATSQMIASRRPLLHFARNLSASLPLTARPMMRCSRPLTLAANLWLAGWLILLAGPPWPWLKFQPAGWRRMGLEHPQESSLTLTASVARPRMRWARLLTLAANLGILGGAGWLILLAGPPWPWLKIRQS